MSLGESTAILGNNLSEEAQFNLNFKGLVGKMPNFKPLMTSNSFYHNLIYLIKQKYFYESINSKLSIDTPTA